MLHVYNREDCQPTNVSGPKSICIKCENVCYLKCHGFITIDKINGLEAVKWKISENFCAYSLVSQLAFVCCSDKTPSNELKKSLKMPSTRSRSTSKTRQIKASEVNASSIVDEFSNLKDALTAIQTSIDANAMKFGNKLNEIHGTTDDIRKHTTTLVDRATRPFPTNNAKNFSSPIQSNTPMKSFANVLRENTAINSAKRKRSENTPNVNEIKSKFIAPKAKTGTKPAVTGLSIIAQPKRVEKPNFSKSVWVSGFGPDTPSEQISNYILQNTTITDKAKFNIHKLVKKGQDVSSLKFVSFKIEVNDVEFDLLVDPDSWPENVRVREFLRERNLGDFFPSLKAKKSDTSTHMDIESPKSVTPTETRQAAKH